MTSNFTLEREQTIDLPMNEVFDFFSDPYNLEALTPPWLRFRVLACSTPTMREGTTIDYQLRVRGVPIRWRSLISSWAPPLEFVDEQVAGPYRSWVHRHSFIETPDGVLMRDRVDYSPLGGALVNRLFVRSDLRRIFDYRQKQLVIALRTRPMPRKEKTA